MGTERLLNLPPGYSPAEFPETGITVPRPDGWFIATEYLKPNVKGLKIGISSDPQTQFTVFFWWEVGSNERFKPSEQAQGITSQKRKVLIDDLQTEDDKERGFITYRATFYVPDEDKINYIETTANDEEGTLHIATFETPRDTWEQYRETAKVLIEKTVWENLD